MTNELDLVDDLATFDDADIAEGAIVSPESPVPFFKEGSVHRIRKDRQAILAFQSVQVPPNETVRITIRPTMFFKGKTLAFSPACAQDFVITDFQIGKHSQINLHGEVPAFLFAWALDKPDPPELNFDVAYPAMDITLTVRNTSDGPRRIEASIIGTYIE